MNDTSGEPGVVANAQDALTITRLEARKGELAALRSHVRERFNVGLPAGPRHVESSDVGFVGVGVHTWLMLSAGAAASATALATARAGLNALATLTDQTGAYVVLNLTGSKVRDMLAKLVALDLHEQVCDVGFAATTLASHIVVTLWRLADSESGAARFAVAVPRSYSESFWHVLRESAAEFGFSGR